MILDLFAGPGGWSEGIRSCGIGPELGVEWDKDACLTRAAAGHRTVRTDVSLYPPEAFTGRVRGLIASPPCQAWSMAGCGAGRREIARIHAAVEACREGWTEPTGEWEDERTPLILEPLRWAWAIRPRWIACEQVPPGLPVWTHMADILRAWGYSADAAVLNSADYGVPQTRKRAFLLASLDGVRWPEPTHAKHPRADLFGGETLPWVTMAEALGWGITDEPSGVVRSHSRSTQGGADPMSGGSGGRAKYHRAKAEGRWAWAQRRNSGPAAERAPRSLDQSSYTIRAAGSGSHPSGVEWVRTSYGEPHRGKDAGSPRPEFDPNVKPSRTVCSKTGDWVKSRPSTTVQADPRIGPPGHKDREGGEPQFQTDAIRVQLHEAAILQGFPRDYPFQGSKTSQFRQVGNAVPPPVAGAIITALEAP